MDDLLNTKSAANYLGVCENTMYKWRHLSNIGPDYLMLGEGNLVRYERSDLDAYKSKCRIRPELEDYYTVEEVARSLRCRLTTVRRWIDTGQLKAYNFNGKKVSDADLKAFKCRKLVKPGGALSLVEHVTG